MILETLYGQNGKIEQIFALLLLFIFVIISCNKIGMIRYVVSLLMQRDLLAAKENEQKNAATEIDKDNDHELLGSINTEPKSLSHTTNNKDNENFILPGFVVGLETTSVDPDNTLRPYRSEADLEYLSLETFNLKNCDRNDGLSYERTAAMSERDNSDKHRTCRNSKLDADKKKKVTSMRKLRKCPPQKLSSSSPSSIINNDHLQKSSKKMKNDTVVTCSNSPPIHSNPMFQDDHHPCMYDGHLVTPHHFQSPPPQHFHPPYLESNCPNQRREMSSPHPCHLFPILAVPSPSSSSYDNNTNVISYPTSYGGNNCPRENETSIKNDVSAIHPRQYEASIETYLRTPTTKHVNNVHDEWSEPSVSAVSKRMTRKNDEDNEQQSVTKDDDDNIVDHSNKNLIGSESYEQSDTRGTYVNCDRFKMQFIYRINQLRTIKTKYGSCNEMQYILKEYPNDPSLPRWVRYIRTEIRSLKEGMPSRMNKERIELLRSLDFDFDKDIPYIRIKNDQFLHRVNQLRTVQIKFGTCNVRKHLLKEYPNDISLIRWVRYIRSEMRSYKKGKPSALDKERIEHLQSVDFDFL